MKLSMSLYLRVPLMFAMGFFATWLSARVARRVVNNEAFAAAMHGLVLSSLAVVATSLYVNDLRTAPALVIGNCIGTYISVRTDRKNR